MKKLLFAFLFIVSAGLTIQAQESDPYKETLRKMMQVSGSLETFKAATDQIFTMYKQQNTAVPDEVWSEIKISFDKTSIDDLTEMLTPVYKNHMTQEDLEAIITFYSTPVGKKFASETPAIMQESMQIGQQWGMQLGQEMAAKLKEKGY